MKGAKHGKDKHSLHRLRFNKHIRHYEGNRLSQVWTPRTEKGADNLHNTIYDRVSAGTTLHTDEASAVRGQISEDDCIDSITNLV